MIPSRQMSDERTRILHKNEGSGPNEPRDRAENQQQDEGSSPVSRATNDSPRQRHSAREKLGSFSSILDAASLICNARSRSWDGKSRRESRYIHVSSRNMLGRKYRRCQARDEVSVRFVRHSHERHSVCKAQWGRVVSR